MESQNYPTGHLVYFARFGGDTRFIKIGYTKTLGIRIETHKEKLRIHGNSPEVELIHFLPCHDNLDCVRVEKWFHQRLKDYRVAPHMGCDDQAKAYHPTEMFRITMDDDKMKEVLSEFAKLRAGGIWR